MKHLFLFISILFSIIGWSQPRLTRSVNSTLANYHKSHPEWNSNNKLHKWGKTDTLRIPFFDDFVSTNVYPDSTRWFNNMVFVNNDFPIDPPSYGVATFDDLDSKGRPYQELNFSRGPCDTLLSLPINLKDSIGKSYGVGDSVYFSFFYQRQGKGDLSDDQDSFIMQFRDSGNKWNSVWKAKGGSVSPFSMVIIELKNAKYFHRGFQFRFINFSRHTGNLNQWHLDYVHLARSRRLAVKHYNDFAIQSRPTSLLKNYYQMPYDHFLADAANQRTDSVFFYASNLSNTTLNIEARQTESSGGTTIVSTNFINNAANVPANSNEKRRFISYNFGGLTGSPVVIKREYELRESGISSKYTPNDKITVYQEFNSCYAYDDGTAEYGFGYDDDALFPEYDGAIAYKFNLTKSDTLWGIGMFFNRSEESTAAIRFDIKVWKKISPIGKLRNADVSLLTMAGLNPKFTDSINGFHVFYLDSPLVLPKGDFFLGWQQLGHDNLDIGWDMNNGYHPTETSSNLFYSDWKGFWQEYPTDELKGALMIRPYVGTKKILGPAGSKEITKQQIKAYPNPFSQIIRVDDTPGFSKMSIYDLSGKLVMESENREMNTTELAPGLYTLQVTTQNSKRFHQKILKLQ